jgi:exonuclease VII small subunit
MQTDKHLARHDSQIARLEQVMTALAEAQVKTEESTDRLNRAMAELAESQRDLQRQWQAYLNTIRPQ